MSLYAAAGAPTLVFKIEGGDDDDDGCLCGLIEFRRWAADKESPIPWLCLHGYNPIDIALVPAKGVRFLACTEPECKSFWEVPVAGWSRTPF